MSSPDVSRSSRLPLRDWLSRPLRVTGVGSPATLSLRWLGRAASLVSTGIPALMMIVGVVGAILAAVWAEQPGGEGPGTLGVEAGAALWFGGAVALGGQRSTTVVRGLLVVAVAVATLIVLALALDWTGAPLALAMEFGVGAIAVLVIDVILLGRVHAGAEQLAGVADTAVVTVQFARSWPVVDVRLDRGNDPAG